ncbi:MAG: hypothetical protein Q4G68_11735 [Planctomycetia bacterium]|nr:hypothetical protein [Planctomycetia bacterium]
MSTPMNVTRRGFLSSAAVVAAELLSPVFADETNNAAENPKTPVWDGSLKAIRFKFDVTPPVGAQIAFSKNERTDAPIYVSGAVIDDGVTRVVWCSCDFLYIIGSAYDLWREKLAEVAQVPVDHVFLHSVHQHDSIRVSLADDVCPVPDDDCCLPIDETWQTSTLDAITGQLRTLVAGSWTPISQVMTAERRVSGLAANRMAFDKNGKMHWRGGMCTDPVAQSLPTGLIDPFLRTICLTSRDDHQPFIAFHFYATHPQSAYRRKMVGPDVPGFAVHYAEEHTQNCVHVYFNGCGANLSFGKYNPSGDAHAIELLGTRLGTAIVENMKVLTPTRSGPITLAHAPVLVPIDWSRIERRDPDSLALVKRVLPQRQTSHISLASLGPDVHFLSFGLGELCIEYQLYAQSIVPESFLATAAYSDCYYQYMHVGEMIKKQIGEGAPGSCWALPEIETVLHEAIRNVLAEI